jgi:hypothetical protein
MSILLHEIYKFLNFAGASNFMFMRLGTSGVCSYGLDIISVVHGPPVGPVASPMSYRNVNQYGHSLPEDANTREWSDPLSRLPIALTPVRYFL